MIDYKTAFLSISLFLSSVITAIFFAWLVLAPMNFLYGVWHDYGGIAEAIEKYGPKNKFKAGFADTSREQRMAVFHDINIAVHSLGEGLADIVYETPSSNGKQQLLREPEVIHLEDVAKLLFKLLWLALFAIVAFVMINIYAWRKKRRLFDVKKQVYSMFSLCVLCGLVLVIFGPAEVFNQFHIWVFPAENTWFFYYQESLMSTLMWAPHLFGWIGGSLAVLALCFYAGWLAIIHRCLNRFGYTITSNNRQ